MSVYIKIKYRIFGITWRVDIYKVALDGVSPVDEVPAGADKKFSKNGVTVYVREGF